MFIDLIILMMNKLSKLIGVYDRRPRFFSKLIYRHKKTSIAAGSLKELFNQSLTEDCLHHPEEHN